MRLLVLLLPLSFLAACQTNSTPLAADIAPAKAKIDDDLKEKCSGVVDIPDKALSWPETTRLWAIDRTSLGECAPRHNALVDSVAVIEQ